MYLSQTHIHEGTGLRFRIVTLAAVMLGGAVLAQDSVRRSETLERAGYDVLAPVLAAWIAQSRDDALERGVERIPAQIRGAFSEYMAPELLDSVRWRVEGQAGLLGWVVFQPGATRALTLDHVILFATEAEAANAKLWAHELYHVMQFREWGIDGFAERFVKDHRAIEHDAREFRWSWMKATGRVPGV
jgi:hypothetical protein